MKTLTPAERRACRAKAHALHPVVTIGQHGLTPAVLHEIDVALLAHELIKIRVFSDDRAARDALLDRICAELDGAPVQHLGKVLIVFRSAPEPEPAEPTKPTKPSKRVTASVAAKPRKRAPPTTKGPFEPGRRKPRATGAVEMAGDAARRRRRAAVR